MKLCTDVVRKKNGGKSTRMNAIKKIISDRIGMIIKIIHKYIKYLLVVFVRNLFKSKINKYIFIPLRKNYYRNGAILSYSFTHSLIN